MQLLPALSPNEQNTYYITRGAGARDKLLCVRSLGFGDSLSLQHTLVIPDRYHGPVLGTSWQPPISDLSSPLTFRFPLCSVQLPGPHSARKLPEHKAVPGFMD